MLGLNELKHKNEDILFINSLTSYEIRDLASSCGFLLSEEDDAAILKMKSLEQAWLGNPPTIK